MDKFTSALNEESTYPATPHIIELIHSHSEILCLKKNNSLINYNEPCRDIFFVKKGCIIGSVINSEGTERVIGFGLTGSLIYSAHSFSGNLPSIYCYRASCDTEVLRITKETCDRLTNVDHEFCRWLLGALELRILFTEKRSEHIYGNSLLRYKTLISKRPEILELVSDKIIALYLNITQVHLSRIKRKLLEENS